MHVLISINYNPINHLIEINLK